MILTEESSPASPEVERMDILSAPASPDEVNEGWNSDAKTEVIPDTAVSLSAKVGGAAASEEQNVVYDQKDPKLKSSCVVMVENLGTKSRRPVHPSTPSNVNTSPLAAKSPLDICSPALPTTSTLSETWACGSPKGTQDVSPPLKLRPPAELSPPAEPPKTPADNRHFLSSFSDEIKAEVNAVSPSKLSRASRDSSENENFEQNKSDPSPFQVTDYRAIFNKQESAQTRTDLTTEQVSVESPTVSKDQAATVPSSPADSLAQQDDSLPPFTAQPSSLTTTTEATLCTATTSSNAASPLPAATLASILPSLDSALDSLATSLALEELTNATMAASPGTTQEDFASGRSSANIFTSSATPSPAVSAGQAIIPSPSASGDWSNSPKTSPSFGENALLKITENCYTDKYLLSFI